MNKGFFFTLILFATAFLSAYSQDSIIPVESLPNEINAYVQKHFAGQTIKQATEDRDDYEITLGNMISLEFNRKLEITEIDGNTRLPDSVIPGKILSHVRQHYKNNFITGWQLDDNNQEIELDNGLDLDFSLNGEFLHTDK